MQHISCVLGRSHISHLLTLFCRTLFGWWVCMFCPYSRSL